MRYVELHARSAFSFLRGASTPEQLAEKAASLALPAMALCDRDGVYGAPRLFGRATEAGMRAIVGAELSLEDETVLPVLVESRKGYQNLCQLLTRAHLRSEKGKARVRWDELPEFAEGLIALTGDEEGPLVKAVHRTDLGRKANSNSPIETPFEVLRRLKNVFGSERVYVEIQRHHLRGEERTNNALLQLARAEGLPLLATNGVLYASVAERPVLDVFTCIRHHTHLDAAGLLLAQNNERCLKSPEQMVALFRDCPEAIENTVRLAERLEFTLENLGYEFPEFPVPEGHTMDSFLREQALAGARERYGHVPEKVRHQLDHELALIRKLKVAGYFLIVWDIVRFCRENRIMAQGRGSAANSTVCFCLGITAVDPLRFHTLFERFLSEGRKNAWPDIDIDLPSGERRERVIQEVYRRYGPQGAAMTANVITFRGRSAAREAGKALNLPNDVLNRFSSLYANGDFPHTLDLTAQMERSGLPREHPRAPAFVALCRAMQGLPRHLGQHSGGMIISQGKLSSIVPLENASMPNRVVAQWDKDDCEDLGIIKVDFLGLGMMSVLQDSVELARERGRPVDLAQLPQDDARTFEMMQSADTIGVFQIESRAQMATLPRMKPKCFYDVVIEVAIIRPGPIQGRLMHPYQARAGDVLSSRSEAGAGADAGRAVVPGTDAGDRDGDGGLQRRRGGGTAARLELSPVAGTNAACGEETARGHGTERASAADDRGDSVGDRFVRVVRFSRVARDQFRASGVRVGVLEGAPRAGILREPAEQPADGVLFAGHAGEGRPAARRPVPPRLRVAIGLELHGRGRFRGRQCAAGFVHCARPEPDRRGTVAGSTAHSGVHVAQRHETAGAVEQGRMARAGRSGRVELLCRAPAGRALGGGEGIARRRFVR